MSAVAWERRPARDRLAPFALLTAVDCVAVATLARCFSGPGELMVLVPACLVAHLLAGGGRRLASRMAGARSARAALGASGPAGAVPAGVVPLGAESDGGRALRRALSVGGWVAAVIVGGLLPLVAVDGGTWHAVHAQLGSAWHIFSDKIAPVAETPGLVIAAGWASAAVALASEILYSDVGLPAVLALVPAFDVVVFAGTLGTPTGRAFELVALAGLAISFLVESQGDRRPARPVVSARVDGDAPVVSRGHRRTRGVTLPAVTVLAAVAAGVIGPVLPGATSAPLVAWHGAAAGRAVGGAPGTGSGSGGSSYSISGLVSVAEQEIDNPDTSLLTIHSATATREVLFTLDRFNGIEWSRIVTGAGQSRAVPSFRGSVPQIAAHPPAATTNGDGQVDVEQAIHVDGLSGPWLPVPASPESVLGDGTPSELGADGPVVASVPLTRGLEYAVRAVLPPTSSVLGTALLGSEPADDPDLALPRPVPSNLVTLAHEIVVGASNLDQEALDLQDYFLSGAFRYELPKVAPTGAVADTTQSYAALEAFLFHSRVGYCQQFATAYAVLARIDGLPTRIAVGFLPGQRVAPDTYVVTGTDVHAWPEVDFPEYGWVTFEPTPSSPGNGIAPPSTTVPPTTIVPVGGGTTTTTRPRANIVGPPKTAGKGGSKPPAVHHRHRSSRSPRGGTSGLTDLLAALFALGIAWVIAVPSWRAVLARSQRQDPGRATRGAWDAALVTLAAAGAHRRRSETHREFAQRVRSLGILNEEANGALTRLAEREDRLLYGRGEVDERSALTARAESALVRRAARRRIAWWQQLFMVVDPRDLLGG